MSQLEQDPVPDSMYRRDNGTRLLQLLNELGRVLFGGPVRLSCTNSRMRVIDVYYFELVTKVTVS